jgi:hypothetical protein
MFRSPMRKAARSFPPEFMSRRSRRSPTRGSDRRLSPGDSNIPDVRREPILHARIGPTSSADSRRPVGFEEPRSSPRRGVFLLNLFALAQTYHCWGISAPSFKQRPVASIFRDARRCFHFQICFAPPPIFVRRLRLLLWPGSDGAPRRSRRHFGREIAMKKTIVVLVCAFTCLSAGNAAAAVKYKRYPACAGGPVTEKTCECHASATPATPASHRFHYCHAGQSCDTSSGKCAK